MNAWVQVDKLQDAEPVNADTLNRPVDQLASRTDYLKKRLGTIMEDGYQSALVLTDVDLIQDDNDPFVIGNIVYRDDEGFRKAQAKMSLYDNFTAEKSAFTLGILISMTGSVGDVLIYGKLDLGTATLLTKTNLLQSGETFRSGRYYLSATEAGKVTANPNGPLIYVGSFHEASSSGDTFSGDSVAYVNPQFLDIGTSHVHRAYSLMARPAGTVIDGDIIGYLPIGAVESSGSSSSSSSSDESNHYPSLIFSGTWTSTNDVNYVFSLVGNEWGNVKLQWYKNGVSTKYKEVEIPAPGVFVDLDNGLQVKVLFPEATKEKAYDNLDISERTWNLTFPYAGKGWVNHAVEAIASITNEYSNSSDSSDSDTGNDGTLSPSLKAVFRGSWPDNDNTVFCLFPSVTYEKTFTQATLLVGTTVTIGGTIYEFVTAEDDELSEDTNIPVIKAATLEESLYNLAKAANTSASTAQVFVNGATLVVADTTLADYTSTHTGIGTLGLDIVGGIIPVMVVYDINYYMLGDLVLNQPSYVSTTLGNLKVAVYATEATKSSNYTCMPGTRLKAVAYDHAPQAVYDYVMGLHQEVDYYFPPVPAQSAGLFVNGVEMENAALFKDNPTYQIGNKTIYWMEDDVERRPWPEILTHHDEPIDPAFDKTMVFYFIVGFQCASGPVTSLVPAPGSAVKLYTYGTNDEAYTGDLMIDAALDLSVSDAGVTGYNVAKQGKNGKLLAGPVVERLKAGNGIILTQEAGCPIGQGTVTVGLADGTTRGQFNEIALENAKQEKIGLFPYVSLLGWGSSNNIPSAFTAMVRIPSNLDATKDYQMQLRMVMFGATGYDNEYRQRAAGIQLEYNILPDYTDTTNLSLKTGLLVPDNNRSISVPLGHQNGSTWEYKAFDPFVATTDVELLKSKSSSGTSEEGAADVCVPFSKYPIPYSQEFTVKTPVPTLKPGYLLAIRVSRITMPDTVSYVAYTGALGFLTMEWTLEET